MLWVFTKLDKFIDFVIISICKRTYTTAITFRPRASDDLIWRIRTGSTFGFGFRRQKKWCKVTRRLQKTGATITETVSHIQLIQVKKKDISFWYPICHFYFSTLLTFHLVNSVGFWTHNFLDVSPLPIINSWTSDSNQSKLLSEETKIPILSAVTK